MRPANATFVVTPGGLQPVGPQMMAAPAPRFAPAPMFAPAPQFMQRPRMSMATGGWLNLLDVIEGGLAIFFARPATVTPPPTVTDPATNQLNQTKFAAAQSGSLLDAERNRVLINEGGRIVRGVLRWLDTRNQMGRGIL